jgi:hypothetical protein
MMFVQSRSMRWAGHVSHVAERRVHTGFWWGNVWERIHMEDLGLDGSIILNGPSRSGTEAWTGLIWLRMGVGDGVFYVVMNLRAS